MSDSKRLIAVPKGMSPGFYAFMGGVGAARDETGQIMMLANRLGVPKSVFEGDLTSSGKQKDTINEVGDGK